MRTTSRRTSTAAIVVGWQIRYARCPLNLVEALGVAGVAFSEPDDVRELTDGVVLDLAGLTLTADHTPGHTEGSVVFRTTDGGPDGEGLVFAGDLLFAGSIGRTDNAGGDDVAMRASLRAGADVADETIVLPGHGGSTDDRPRARDEPAPTWAGRRHR